MQTYYLPSPPPSLNSNELSPISEKPEDGDLPVSLAQASRPTKGLPSFRRRVGRGGRTIIDRRAPPMSQLQDSAPELQERYRYDNNDDDPDAMNPVYPFDLHSAE